ncbi:hypothetical protein [Paraburkholderia tropica]|uniref:hypothetical protein n=1 Tax=Paraburkholderia tropica TaxID=92647 RepID=UPI000F5551A0|nr:hypothetical protein [Paraburkholderia tropica]RQN40746.1 hypothetical protein EHZ25_00335 [Paraburkholderia tropica]
MLARYAGAAIRNAAHYVHYVHYAHRHRARDNDARDKRGFGAGEFHIDRSSGDIDFVWRFTAYSDGEFLAI